MIIAKQLIIEELRRRGLSTRAEFVDRQLPAEVDERLHGGLLATLGIGAPELAAAAELAKKDSDAS